MIISAFRQTGRPAVLLQPCNSNHHRASGVSDIHIPYSLPSKAVQPLLRLRLQSAYAHICRQVLALLTLSRPQRLEVHTARLRRIQWVALLEVTALGCLRTCRLCSKASSCSFVHFIGIRSWKKGRHDTSSTSRPLMRRRSFKP